MIDLSINKEKLAHNVQVARENNIILPTFAQMRDPQKVPEKVKKALKNVGLWDVNPLNLFRITWHNEPTMEGGQYGGVNFIELPSVLTGVKARIIVLCGKWFPTGCHKVGASYGCLAPRLVTGQFDALQQGCLALHRQLLPWRRLQLQAALLLLRGHPACGNEQGAV